MIKEVTGDIMLSKAQVVAHGVAPHDHFDNGLALSLREDYPSMVKIFGIGATRPTRIRVGSGSGRVQMANAW